MIFFLFLILLYQNDKKNIFLIFLNSTSKNQIKSHELTIYEFFSL
jgi:hypothetical protein